MRGAARLVLAAAIVVVASGLALASLQATSTRRDAERFTQKVDLIVQRGLVPSPSALRTTVTETEINSYLAVYGARDLPTGVMQPRVSILGPERISGTATIDLDAVRRAGSGGWLDPASYLTGKVAVAAQGNLRTANGVARFELESAQVAGVSVPKSLLQQIVSYYSRTPDYPQGVNLDDPFSLPAGIRKIEMRRGAADIVQQ